METCSLCTNPHLAKGYCRKHYLRWYKHNDPTVVLRHNGQPSRDKSGYLIQWIDGKCVKVHRVIMEQHLGRKLLPTEHVHHKNNTPDDNRIENLEVIPAAAHGSKSSSWRWKNHQPRICLECEQKAIARGLCPTHYYRAKKAGKLPSRLKE